MIILGFVRLGIVIYGPPLRVSWYTIRSTRLTCEGLTAPSARCQHTNRNPSTAWLKNRVQTALKPRREFPDTTRPIEGTDAIRGADQRQLVAKYLEP